VVVEERERGERGERGERVVVEEREYGAPNVLMSGTRILSGTLVPCRTWERKCHFFWGPLKNLGPGVPLKFGSPPKPGTKKKLKIPPQLCKNLFKTHILGQNFKPLQLLRIEPPEQSESRSWGFLPAARPASPLWEAVYIILHAHSAYPPAPPGSGGWGAGGWTLGGAAWRRVEFDARWRARKTPGNT
jgi:hypothetical protein